VSSPSDRRSLDRLRDDLAALHIDRSAAPRRWSPQAMLAVGLAGLVVVTAGLLAGYRIRLGPTAAVQVGYAARMPEGGANRAPSTALTGSGYVITEAHYISLGVRVAGRIVKYRVEEGERVHKGQPLVELDARPLEVERRRLEAQRAVAQANVDLRRKELQRLVRLRVRDVSSESEVDLKENQMRVAEAELAQSEADLSRVRLDLEDMVLRSPVNGVVLEKLKESGEMAMPGGFAGSGELIRLANLEELRAEVDVNESDLVKVSLHQEAAVVPDADPGRRYAARVVELAPQVNRAKGTLRVKVRILEPDAWLKPDMSARISFLEPRSPALEGAQVLAPAGAIHSDAHGSFAWVISQGHVRRQPVESAPASGDQVAIRAGLLGGEALVLGDADLRDGQRVSPEP
jgi:HlyD family secretion protein